MLLPICQTAPTVKEDGLCTHANTSAHTVCIRLLIKACYITLCAAVIECFKYVSCNSWVSWQTMIFWIHDSDNWGSLFTGINIFIVL